MDAGGRFLVSDQLSLRTCTGNSKCSVCTMTTAELQQSVEAQQQRHGQPFVHKQLQVPKLQKHSLVPLAWHQLLCCADVQRRYCGGRDGHVAQRSADHGCPTFSWLAPGWVLVAALHFATSSQIATAIGGIRDSSSQTKHRLGHSWLG